MIKSSEKKSINNNLIAITALCLIILAAGSVAAQNKTEYLPVPAGMVFQRNVKYVSESGNHYLIFQDDGNLVVYDKDNRFIWGVNTVTDKFRKAAINIFGQGGTAEFRKSGIFGIFYGLDLTGGEKLLWSPPINSNTAAFLTIRENGSLQLIANDGSVVWSTDDKNAAIVKASPGDSALDLKTNLAGTWSGGNNKFVISQDKITMLENGQIKWSGKYTITGENKIAITYDDGRKADADMIVSERMQGPKLVKRLRWDIKSENMGGSYQWESNNTQVAESNVANKAPAKPVNKPSNEPEKPKEPKNSIIGTWVVEGTRFTNMANYPINSKYNLTPGQVVVIDRKGRYLTYDSEGKLLSHNYYWINEHDQIIIPMFTGTHAIFYQIFNVGLKDTSMSWAGGTEQIVYGGAGFKLRSRDTDVKLGDSLGEKIIGLWIGISGTNTENEKLNVFGDIWHSISSVVRGKEFKLSVPDNETVLLNPIESDPQAEIKLKVSINGDTMTVTDDKGVQKKYNRPKSMDSSGKFTELPF